MHEEQIYLVNEDICLLSLLPVPCDAVQNGIKYDKHSYSSELLAEFKNVVANQTVACVDIRLLCKGVERTPREKLKFKRKGMSLRFRLPQEFLPEILKCWRRSHIVALFVIAVDILRAAVNDGLLPLLELVPCYDLLAKRLQELTLLLL